MMLEVRALSPVLAFSSWVYFAHSLPDERLLSSLVDGQVVTDPFCGWAKIKVRP